PALPRATGDGRGGAYRTPRAPGQRPATGGRALARRRTRVQYHARDEARCRQRPPIAPCDLPESGNRGGLDPSGAAAHVRVAVVRYGMGIEEISRLVGHSSTLVTQTVYRHELRPVVTSGAEMMDRIFADGAKCLFR